MSLMPKDFCVPELTVEALVDLETPKQVRLCPSGDKIIYTLSTVGKRGEHNVSSIWVAEVGREHSARQLTSGQFKDDSP